MPLSRFIDLTCNDYRGAVVIEGNPPESEIESAIDVIRNQYADTTGDGEFRHYLALYKSITHIDLTLSQVAKLVETMRQAYNPLLAQALNKLVSANFVFDISKPAEYDELLNRCIRRSNGSKIERDLKKMQYDALIKKFSDQNKKPVPEYFIDTLIALSNHAGNHLSAETITVYEFCKRLKMLNDQAEKSKTKRRRA